MNTETLQAEINRMRPSGYPVRFGDEHGVALGHVTDVVTVWQNHRNQSATVPITDVQPVYRVVVATITVEHRVGGEHLVSLNTMTGEAVILTGPTPWGSGTWGPFPASAVSGVREPRETDSWPVCGCPDRRWTVNDLNRAIARARS